MLQSITLFYPLYHLPINVSRIVIFEQYTSPFRTCASPPPLQLVCFSVCTEYIVVPDDRDIIYYKSFRYEVTPIPLLLCMPTYSIHVCWIFYVCIDASSEPHTELIVEALSRVSASSCALEQRTRVLTWHSEVQTSKHPDLSSSVNRRASCNSLCLFLSL